MNTNYDLKRIALLLRADWMEYRKGYLLSMGVLFLVWMLGLFFEYRGGHLIPVGGGFWSIGMMIVFILFCQHAGRKMHRSKGIYLLLPASKEEKYTALLLEALAYFVGFQILFWGGILIWKPFMPVHFYPAGNANGSEAGTIFLSALLFLSYMSFRKHAFLIVVGGMTAFAFVFVFAVLVLSELIHLTDAIYYMSYLPDTLLFLGDCYTPVMVISALVTMYVAYLKLKEKEER
ncbi:MAG: hypothetical protein LBS05_07520 [Tannerellaceae bacterium]|jgi:hypothetical protein|nr:hypothetical protein [Tannerellaceae bacterium]